MTNDDLAVLDFWFRELTPAQWFENGETLDPVVRERFGELHEAAARGERDHWAGEPRSRLALILVLDQFSRHIHRGHAAAFAHDPRACELCLDGIARGFDEQLNLAERHFFYMPLMHSEARLVQARGIEQFEKLVEFAQGVLDFARDHAETIERFGRFPYRNAALGRTSTAAEKHYLASGKYPA